MVVKPKDQQVRMTAGHQRSETDRSSGASVAGKLPSFLAARPDGLAFLLAVSFRIPVRLLPRSLHSGKASMVPP